MGKSKRERRNLRRQKALPYQVPQGLAMAVDEFAPKDEKIVSEVVSNKPSLTRGALLQRHKMEYR